MRPPYWEQEHHWPVESYKNRKPYTQEDIDKITAFTCPRCGSLLFEETDINGGEKGTYLKCHSCSRQFYTTPIEIPDFSAFRSVPRKKISPVKEREFVCAKCGKTVKKIAPPNAKYCSPECYAEVNRYYNREFKRRKNGTKPENFIVLGV